MTADSAADAEKIRKAAVRISDLALKYYNSATVKSCDECFTALVQGNPRGCRRACADDIKEASIYLSKGCGDAPSRCKMSKIKNMCKCTTAAPKTQKIAPEDDTKPLGTTTLSDSADAEGSTDTGDAGDSGSGSITAIVVAIIVIVFVIGAAVAVVFMIKNKQDNTTDDPTAFKSFENPAYTVGGPSQTVSVSHPEGGDAAPAQSSRYMDVTPKQPSGYMDVAPNQPSGHMDVAPNQSSGYMDVSPISTPNQSGGYADVTPNDYDDNSEDEDV